MTYCDLLGSPALRITHSIYLAKWMIQVICFKSQLAVADDISSNNDVLLQSLHLAQGLESTPPADWVEYTMPLHGRFSSIKTW